MKSISVLSVVFCGLLFITTNTHAEMLTGQLGSAQGTGWQSSWLNLKSIKDFTQGDTLKIKLRGRARNVLVRLLPQGVPPDTSVGIDGDIRHVPQDGVLVVRLEETHENVVQISVHGGQLAWNTQLGRNNGPVYIVSVNHNP